MKTTITIPLNSDYPSEQLQAIVMALVHSYGLPAVLTAMHQGLLEHYDETRTPHNIQGPVLDSINVASVVADQLLQKEA